MLFLIIYIFLDVIILDVIENFIKNCFLLHVVVLELVGA